MNKRRTELTLFSHIFLLLSAVMIITSISVPIYIDGFSACANKPDHNSITTFCQVERNASLQNPANNITSDPNSNGIVIIGHNATAGVHLVGNVKLSSLPRSVPAESGGQQPHVIPFHPKNLTSFLAEKRQADLGLIKPSVRVFAIQASNNSFVNQTK